MALSATRRAARASGRVSSNWYCTEPSGCGSTSRATRPVRSATRALSGDSCSTARPASARAAVATRVASGVEPTTAMCATSAGRLRNAMPRPIASSTGNANVQKSASGSRMNSLNRTDESCTSDGDRPKRRRDTVVSILLIAKLPAGEVNEYVFERRGVRPQFAEVEVATRQLGEQCWNGAMELARPELEAARSVAIADDTRPAHALEPSQGVLGQL